MASKRSDLPALMATYYVTRTGWNACNQSGYYAPDNPKNDFESNRVKLVAVVKAGSRDEAIRQAEEQGVVVYNNQYLSATTNPRSQAGLTAAIREFNAAVAMMDECC